MAARPTVPTPLRRRAALQALAAAAAVCAVAGAGAAGAAPAPGPAPGPDGPVEWVVGADDAASAGDLQAALEAAGASVERLPRLDALAVSGSREAVAGALAGEDGVDYVERPVERALHGEPADATDRATGRVFGWWYGAVRAGEGIAAAGGGAPTSPVAVVDSGVDVGHPDLAGRLMAGHDVLGGGSLHDRVGHGTFVAALIGAVDGNRIGGRGVAGATPIIPVRVSSGSAITSAGLAAGIVAAVDRGARVVNISIGGSGISSVEGAALDYARQRDVLVVASAGNSALDGNPVEYPAAAVGGEAGGWSAGLSVAATDPLGQPAVFSTHNQHVSIAAPGAGLRGCRDGIYSAIPSGPTSLWDGYGCSAVFWHHGPGRYAYGQGTSFAAPLVAGAAALVRQVAPGLRAEQVGDVLRRSAVQTVGRGWNPRTGAGVLDVAGAVALASRYDTTPPALVLAAEPRAGAVRARAWAEDATAPGKELAGEVSVGLEVSRDGTTWSPMVAPSAAPIDAGVASAAARPVWLRATACDRNRNCTTRSSGPHAAAAPRPAARGRLHGAILRLRVSRHCAAAGAPCLRLAVSAAPARAGRVRFSVTVRQPGSPRVVAKGSGALKAGRRRALSLASRAPLACGRVVAQLTVRSGRRVGTATRRAPVRRCLASVTIRPR